MFCWRVLHHGLEWKHTVYDIKNGEFHFLTTCFFLMFSSRFFFSIFFISWRLISLQHCSGFAIYWHESAMDLYVFPIPIPPPSASHPSGSSQCTSPEHLSHASNLGWWSVSPLIVYLFQSYSLRTSHPRLLP